MRSARCKVGGDGVGEEGRMQGKLGTMLMGWLEPDCHSRRAYARCVGAFKMSGQGEGRPKG